MKVCCNVHEEASEVVDAYINSIGFLELVLKCGCKVHFKLHRIPQKGEKMLSDVFDEIISKLQEKAKSGVNILEEVENSDFTIVCRFSDNIDECLSCRCSGCKWKEEKKWVRLDDVESAIRQIKQNYDLVSKEFFDLLLEMEKSLDNKCKWEAKEVVSALIRRYKELLKNEAEIEF